MIGPDDLLARSGHARVLVSQSVSRSNMMPPALLVSMAAFDLGPLRDSQGIEG